MPCEKEIKKCARQIFLLINSDIPRSEFPEIDLDLVQKIDFCSCSETVTEAEGKMFCQRSNCKCRIAERHCTILCKCDASNCLTTEEWENDNCLYDPEDEYESSSSEDEFDDSQSDYSESEYSQSEYSESEDSSIVSVSGED